MRILYVEDNPLDADLVRMALARETPAPQLLRVETLRAAREALAAGPAFDLLLVDLNLPDGSGLDLLAEVRRDRLPVATVLLTGQGDEDLVTAVLRAGADDYLPKTEGFADRVASTARAALRERGGDVGARTRPLNVLYVEHHLQDIDLTRRHFAQHAPHLRIVSVGSAREALQRLAPGGDGHPAVDVLLVDFLLSGDTGLDLLKQLRRELALDIPLVLVTGQGSEDIAAMAMRLGATDYVVKREGYLIALPVVVENAFHRVQAAREAAALRELNASLERKVAQRTADLAAAKEQAEAASRGKSEFLARMSHDLRTPLNAVLGFAQLLEIDPAVAASSAAQQMARHVASAGRHLLEMIDDLLDLGRIESGGVRLSPEPVDLRRLLLDCVTLTQSMAEAGGITVHDAVGADGLCVTADRLRLRQVLVNLIGNAIKYNRRGGRVDLGVTADERCVRLEIRDTGVGMTRAQLDGLFQAFNRVGAEGSGVEGTGLGLVIARRLVEAMHGRLEVASVPGTGSTFTVALPRDAREPAAAADPTPAPVSTPKPVPDGRRHAVVYVEDNPVNVLLMEQVLALRGDIALEVATEGAAGLALARRLRPELLLVDLDLPDMDGLEVVRRVHADPALRELPCVAVSASAMAADRHRAREAGCIGFVVKPFAIPVLLAEVDRHLR